MKATASEIEGEVVVIDWAGRVIRTGDTVLYASRESLMRFCRVDYIRLSKPTVVERYVGYRDGKSIFDRKTVVDTLIRVVPVDDNRQLKGFTINSRVNYPSWNSLTRFDRGGERHGSPQETTTAGE